MDEITREVRAKMLAEGSLVTQEDLQAGLIVPGKVHLYRFALPHEEVRENQKTAERVAERNRADEKRADDARKFDEAKAAEAEQCRQAHERRLAATPLPNTNRETDMQRMGREQLEKEALARKEGRWL